MMENTKLGEMAQAGVLTRSVQPLGWHCEFKVEKYAGAKQPGQEPYETIKGEHNTLLNGGADVIWERLVNLAPSTSSTGVVTQAFSSVAKLGVGASTVAAAASQTGLQTTGTKTYVTMTTGYPSHTTGTSTSARSAQFKASFGTSQANYAWNEWALCNATGGRHLNRKVQALGTKTSAATWDLTVTLTLS